MTLTERTSLKHSVLDKYEKCSMEKYGIMESRLSTEYILSLCREAELEDAHTALIREYLLWLESEEDIKKLIWLHYYLRFETDESYFDNLWEGGLEDVPIPSLSEKKFPGMFISVVYLLAAEHLKRAARNKGLGDRIIKEYYGNFKRFSGMNLISHNTYGLCRLGSFLYCYAYPTICRVGRFNFQIIPFKNYLDVYENKEGKRFLAARDTHTYGEDGLQDENSSFRPKIKKDENTLTAHTFDGSGRLTRKKYTIDLTEYKRILTEGDIVITVHIPEGGKMYPEIVKESLCDAKTFFKEKFPEWNIKAIVCQTWFLDPALRPILGENSNMAAFQDLFDIAVAADQKLHSLFDHIFKTKPVPLDALTPKNRFQFEMLERAKSGVKMYWAYGILKNDI